jgi:hypothetical protein
MLPDAAASRLLDGCAALPQAALDRLAHYEVEAIELGQLYETLLAVELTCDQTDSGPRWRPVDSLGRRRSGSHYTPAPIADLVIARCLAPLASKLSRRQLLELRICDPAMGAGAFLCAAARFLAAALQQAEQKQGQAPSADHAALRTVVDHCIFGVDRDPTAVLLGQLTLAGLCGGHFSRKLEWQLRCGDSLGEVNGPSSLEGLDFEQAFTRVFERSNPGFDAIVGNPPWVAYVGRATQPLEPQKRSFYERRYRSFHKYRTLHGLFTERCTELLRAGGRLGLVLPTSVADLAGYEPTRMAHDQRCDVDPDLPDLGDGQFAEVFQPSMVLLSTRRSSSARATRAPWQLERRDLSDTGRALLDKLQREPRIPREVFGERGYQTSSADRRKLRVGEAPPDDGWVALRSGTEVGEFMRHPPRIFARPEDLDGRLRPPEQWGQVRVLIRQTARFPIAASADGIAFRNSVLAGFDTEELPWPLLLGYLNSTLVRWFHYESHRDARQGMPQLKIAHLRSLPHPPAAATALGTSLLELGQRLAARNTGISELERASLDDCLAQAFNLTDVERQMLSDWASANPPPRPRSRKPE